MNKGIRNDSCSSDILDQVKIYKFRAKALHQYYSKKKTFTNHELQHIGEKENTFSFWVYWNKL